MDESLALLVPHDVYEQHAVHIGTNQKSADMKKFLDTMREDSSGLHLIDVHHTDSRIRVAAKFLSRYDPERVLVVSARQYGQRPARKFAESIGSTRIVGRFIPGTLTNPRLRTYIEPEVIPPKICGMNGFSRESLSTLSHEFVLRLVRPEAAVNSVTVTSAPHSRASSL